jgi:glycosyltransferase involved in cell wall biosynthesis
MNTIVDFKETTREHILQADIVIFQETGSIKSVEAMNFAKESKKPIVIEMDDEVRTISPRNEGGYGAWNPGTLFIHRLLQQVIAADAMTVSTPQLAREYFPYNKSIYVLPNFLNENKWSNNLVKKQDGYFRIGWAGGNAHIDDLKLISKVVEKIVREYAGKVKFETMGMVKKELDDTFSGLEEFHETCPKCGYQGESVTWTGESLENYPLVLASHGWDLALAPIVNTSFNCAKSDLKLKEYSATGYPVIASSVTPYIEAKKLGCDVLLAETFDEWYNNIKELIDNQERREQMVKNNKEWVAKNWIADNITLYYDAFVEIINKHKLIKQ